MKNKTLGLFDLSDESFNVDDVIQPVERAVNKITVPEIDIEDKNIVINYLQDLVVQELQIVK